MSLSDELRSSIRGEIDDTPQTIEKFSRDAGLFRVVPEVIARPADAADVCSLVSFVNEKNQKGSGHLSLTARSAGTDMSGGPLTSSIVVDMLPHFNKLINIDGETAVVEPGMFFRDFDRATK